MVRDTSEELVPVGQQKDFAFRLRQHEDYEIVTFRQAKDDFEVILLNIVGHVGVTIEGSSGGSG
jgi:hypothetical protein